VYKRQKKYRFVWGNKDVSSKNTIYSINWIPLGGFVKIKGENGDEIKEADSFASKNAWPRIKILAAGVIMNFILAWVLISAGLIIGAPEVVDDSMSGISNSKIQITQVMPGSPAEKAGIKIGDELLKSKDKEHFSGVADVQEYIALKSGEEIVLDIRRGNEEISVSVIPEISGSEGKGMIGVGLAKTAIVKYSVLEAVWKGAVSVYEITILILAALGGIIASLFSGNGVGADVSGPIGIAMMTKQVATLGLVYILQFAALLSINLGIINAMPFPALDGGRILFILIEKIKGSPVSHKTEHMFHTIGFMLLILLMIMVTLKDVFRIIR